MNESNAVKRMRGPVPPASKFFTNLYQMALDLSFGIIVGTVALAAEEPLAPPAPVPVQVGSATKIFVSNDVGDSSYLARYTGGPNGLYDLFYADLKSWGRYELVSAPAEADLVFEISLRLDLEEKFSLPELRLAILDVRTHVLLWTIKEPVQGALRVATAHKNITKAMESVVNDLKKLTTQSPDASGASAR